MIRRSVLFSIGLLLLAVGAALAVLPARWLMPLIPGHWPMAIVDAHGTVWSGSATLAIGPERHRRTLPDPLRWHWSFTHGPRMEIAHPWLGGKLTLVPSWAGIGISAQTLQLPAQALTTLDARIAAIGPGGRLSISWPATHIGRHSRPQGARLLDAEWREAVSALSPVRPLGSYALALRQGAGGGADLTLATRQGPLALEGSGALDGAGRLQFKGTARADPAAGPDVQAALRDVLTALGPRQNDVTLLHYR
ncbi:type II secretion system protein N [Alcaligenaceae bacterium]|nr:type II secretion system protein N [Alcaligenaceae bacterium]